ncbi:hypothetical protein N9V16_05905, partial [SAR116 cluster bacterium]|nr:hypothetical protein [SAR116 cluster bacterium]
EKCNSGAKSFFSSNYNSMENPALQIKANAINLSLGLINQKKYWDNKITYEINLDQNFINNSVLYGKNFDKVNKIESSKIPSQNNWVQNFIKLKASQSKMLSEHIGLGFALTSYIPYYSSFQRNNYFYLCQYMKNLI